MLTEIDIARLIRTLAKAKGWKATTAARHMTGSGDTLARIEGGVRLTLGRAAKIMNNISVAWPSDLDWPSDIPRPAEAKMADPTPITPRKQVSEVRG